MRSRKRLPEKKPNRAEDDGHALPIRAGTRVARSRPRRREERGPDTAAVEREEQQQAEQVEEREGEVELGEVEADREVGRPPRRHTEEGRRRAPQSQARRRGLRRRYGPPPRRLPGACRSPRPRRGAWVTPQTLPPFRRATTTWASSCTSTLRKRKTASANPQASGGRVSPPGGPAASAVASNCAAMRYARKGKTRSRLMWIRIGTPKACPTVNEPAPNISASSPGRRDCK